MGANSFRLSKFVTTRDSLSTGSWIPTKTTDSELACSFSILVETPSAIWLFV
jgi:hypothetical protein